MKAKVEASYDKNRQLLHELIPLDTPFTVVLEPCSYCNLKCAFCIHSLSKDEIVNNGHVFAKMDRETMDLVVKQLGEFPRAVKSVSFVGTGEPLLHEDLPYMIEQLKVKQVAERVTVVTNGILLTNRLSANLVSSGLDALKISINGLTATEYLQNCGCEIDFDKFISQISWLNNNKGEMKLHLKILDTVLGERNVHDFQKVFGDYCDTLSVENTLRSHPGVDYEDLGLNEDKKSFFEEVSVTPEVCSAPFYIMAVRSTGKVHLCSNCWNAPTNESMYVKKRSLLQLWHSAERKQALMNLLQKKHEGLTKKCAICPCKNILAFDEDYLDPYADELYDRILKLEVD